jgi:hypothetical protein
MKLEDNYLEDEEREIALAELAKIRERLKRYENEF